MLHGITVNALVAFPADKHGPEFQPKVLGVKYSILENCLNILGNDEHASNALNLRILRMNNIFLSTNLGIDNHQYQHFLNKFKNRRKRMKESKNFETNVCKTEPSVETIMSFPKVV